MVVFERRSVTRSLSVPDHIPQSVVLLQHPLVQMGMYRNFVIPQHETMPSASASIQWKQTLRCFLPTWHKIPIDLLAHDVEDVCS